MGYLVISDELLSQEQLFDVLRHSDSTNLDEGEIPFEVMLANGNEFYVQLLAKEPYEYLVISMAELGNVLKVANDFDGTHEEVCAMMMVDFQQENQQDPEQPVEQPEEPLQEVAEQSIPEPILEPAEGPAQEPTEEPAPEPTEEPAQEPTKEPSQEPTQEPTQQPTE